NGDVEETTLNYIIRDFDQAGFQARKDLMQKVTNEQRLLYGENRIELEMNDQYYNMKDKIEPVKEIVDIAYEAMENLGIKPIVKPIRGGTDGSQLSYMGLPTPNIFTGGENFHGRFEYISVNNMLKSVETIVEIAKLVEAKA
ncbi:MAG: M20/M25/M40 family metallo-hydrolase, partial [Mesobacillus sp.]|uniref:M20/M25/M40 family metallo-hydrolase n=1 Tax=Mesobacillus sp. TaxID=2675271 RepID=UPI003C4D70BA